MGIFIDYHRRSIRMKGFDCSASNLFFITICTIDREPLFGKIEDGKMILSEYGEIVKRTWNEIPLHYSNIALDEFIVMPDHVHGIIRICDISNREHYSTVTDLADSRLVAVKCVGAGFKPAPTHLTVPSNLTVPTDPSAIEQIPTPLKIKRHPLSEIIRALKTFSARRINELRNWQSYPVWQRNYYEHVIRTENELNEIRKYIRDNPKKWPR